MLEEQKYEFALNKEVVLNGRYIIQDVLGVGGFGITYRAYDLRYNVICAIKELFLSNSVRRHENKVTVLPLEGCEGIYRHGVERFIEEASILHKINDTPYVVKITDFFQENNTAYYVMQYVEGVTLSKLVHDYGGRIPLDLACDITYKVGVSLDSIYREYAIFHRDLSPENIMIDVKGNPIIIDFGNAKTHIRNSDKKMSIVLKPSFAPPEQYTGKGQGPWTDVYSLAGVFYYISTGVKVPPSTERVVGETYPSICNILSECRKELSDCIDQGLCLDYKKRIQNTGLLVQHMKKQPSLVEKKPKVKPVLIVKGGTHKKEQWILPNDTFVILGRDTQMSNIVVSNSPQISKQHMALQYNYNKNCFEIIDVSTNGVYIQGVRLKKDTPYEVSAGTEIILGNNVCTIELRV